MSWGACMRPAIFLCANSPCPAIGELARSVGMSKSTLTKGFKAAFGQTISDFSLRCRMRHALTLMRDQGWSVKRAAEAVGYAHPTSFATAFRRHFGRRPMTSGVLVAREERAHRAGRERWIIPLHSCFEW